MKPGYTVNHVPYVPHYMPNFIECMNYTPLNQVLFYRWILLPKPDQYTVAVFRIKPKN